MVKFKSFLSNKSYHNKLLHITENSGLVLKHVTSMTYATITGRNHGKIRTPEIGVYSTFILLDKLIGKKTR